ncbi:hypothetical protein QSJ18_07255 [Gordonia sp. ABSL1-1]|uniref:hypothetical protein n=1 Tax=Gordonia sp. ABSL1-1 TaxID=3053923 RepID=UPI002573567B|nr:hypothetical protein [Gordonia sp. ABSL1-1]MDL9936535.1 hypothetical protein [Gordonia sp. ABSL1-1]
MVSNTSLWFDDVPASSAAATTPIADLAAHLRRTHVPGSTQAPTPGISGPIRVPGGTSGPIRVPGGSGPIRLPDDVTATSKIPTVTSASAPPERPAGDLEGFLAGAEKQMRAQRATPDETLPWWRRPPALVAAAAVVALVVVGIVVAGGGDDSSTPPAPTTPSVAAAPPADACPSVDGSVVTGRDQGDQTSGAGVIKAFNYAYYVMRSARSAKPLAPKATNDVASLQSYIDQIPPGTTHCVKITQLGPDRYAVDLTEFPPGSAPVVYPQLITTEKRNGRMYITAIKPRG